MIAMPYYTLFEALGPLVETAGYVFVVVLFLLGALQPAFFFAFLALAVLFGILLSICALNLDDLLIKKHRSAGDLAKMTLGSVIEFLGYRQLMTAIRMLAFFTVFLRRGRWDRMHRQQIQANGSNSRPHGRLRKAKDE